MKKTILLFLFILPVIIVVLVFAIAGFVGRTLLFNPVQNVHFNENIFSSTPEYHAQYGTNNLILLGRRGEQFDFERYLVVYPAAASTDQLEFESSNPDVARVGDDGRIHILQNMRSTDPRDGIEIVVMHNVDRFFSVFVIVETDETAFDYFGFDVDLFRVGIESDWEEHGAESVLDFGLRVGFDGQITITKDDILHEENFIPLKAILERGFNVAPFNILYLANEQRAEFLWHLIFTSSNTNVLRISRDGAEIVGIGEVYVTVTTNFRGTNFAIVVSIIIE
ncbi:MAG: hypothetical protein FWC11_06385 [Firmicutes bacterium]|nr:hypothetical protein [Bacillota bacterium]MCL2256458.1 hypothetical protein [Bacillota bacterium]